LCFSVEQTLRDNEKQVWQKLLRVLNHEVRNSLTPISSIAQSLQQMLLEQQSATRDANDRTVELLQVIEKRAQHLLGFVEAYSAFKHIQKPNKQFIEPQKLAISLKALDQRVKVSIEEEAPIFADEGHLQQTFINVIKNASEADTDGNPIEIIIAVDAQHHIIRVLDCGHGIINPDNLFVPFYSTKQDGNGIGLILSRELMRQQGGELTLFSRKDAQGAEARLVLPKA
jgi:signal transduction histidine kinase